MVGDETAGVRTPGGKGNVAHSVRLAMEGGEHAGIQVKFRDALIRSPFIEPCHVGRVMLWDKISTNHRFEHC